MRKALSKKSVLDCPIQPESQQIAAPGTFNKVLVSKLLKQELGEKAKWVGAKKNYQWSIKP